MAGTLQSEGVQSCSTVRCFASHLCELQLGRAYTHRMDYPLLQGPELSQGEQWSACQAGKSAYKFPSLHLSVWQASSLIAIMSNDTLSSCLLLPAPHHWLGCLNPCSHHRDAGWHFSLPRRWH